MGTAVESISDALANVLLPSAADGAPCLEPSGAEGTALQELADAALDSSPDVPLERRLDEVAPSIDASLRDVVAGPVDLLITGNEWAVHGRRPFTTRYDGTDR